MHRSWMALVLSIAGYDVSHACTHPPERVEYAIHHDTYGDVGRHVITFSCQNDDLVVDTKIEGEVRLLAIPLFKRAGTYHEVWRGDRLIAFDSRIVDNDEVYEVSARAAGDHTIIDGRRGRIEAPADIVSNHPWNYAVLERTLLFDTQRGRLQRVQVRPAGTESHHRVRPRHRRPEIRRDRRSRARAMVRRRWQLAAIAPRARRRQDHAHPAIAG